MHHDIEEYFINKGMVNPTRSIHLIKRAVDFLDLNLTNLTVFTEAASGEFIYTPIIAAMAGAEKVYAISKDSRYGLKDEIRIDTMLFAKLCGVENKVEVVFDKEKIEEAHIVTNLGFVRPIDKCTVDKMREDAVVPYMCEAWEVRNGDVDIEYCKEKGINVVGTNENYPGLDVFNFSGFLALKMLFDARIEVYKSKIVIVGGDNFGRVIHKTLSKLSNDVTLIKEINEKNLELVKDVDALIIADYTSNTCYIGKDNSQITSQELKKLSKSVTVIQFAGIVDIEDLNENNIFYYPKYDVGSFRMGKTLAYLGPKPIINLHCAGLKVGEIMYNMKQGLHYKEHFLELCQMI